MKKIDKNKFFREVTLRICGNLEIDKALRACLLYIREYIPADFMGFVIYIPDEECYETIAVAYPERSDTLAVKIPVPSSFQDRMKVDFLDPKITITDSIQEDPETGPIISQMGWPEGSSIIIEMVLAGKRMGALVIIDKKKEQYRDEHAELLSLLNEPLGIALTNSLRYRKVRELKNLLADDKQYLQDEILQMAERKIIGSDYGLKGVMEAVGQVAPLTSPVLLLGETGVGKEVVARAIHNASMRKEGPFIKVNCGAITSSLIDSELFGHEKGAFTGAISMKRGRFERADGGTIFLDECGELPLEAQVRMLRVLQDKEIERVGGEKPFSVDSRIIAATHRDLEGMIRNGGFREDLYFRLKVFPILIPPLRKRRGDIPLLVHHFIQKKSRELTLPGMPTLSPGALDILMNYQWPGNVRELENAVERELIIRKKEPLSFRDLKNPPDREIGSTAPSIGSGDFVSLDSAIADHIRKALKTARGKVEGIDGAAKLLGVNPGTLRQRMRKLGIPFGRKYRGLYRGELAVDSLRSKRKNQG